MPKYFNESTTYVIDCYWYKHNQRKNVTIGLNSYREKIPEPTPLTQPTELSTQRTESSKKKGKAHVLADPESYPSLSDSSLIKSDSSDESNCSKSRNKNESDLDDDKIYRKSKSINTIKRKIARNTRNRTHHNHLQAILFRPTTVTIDTI